MSRNLRWSALVTVLLATLWGVSEAEATPIYAIRSANACDTCHIEPLGWANPAGDARLCTLDCQGCHVSPAGGGLRTPTGQFYGKQVLPMWGTRPGSLVDAKKYLPEGYPEKGRYRLFEGFDGWWAGNVKMEDIPERFGDIDPDPQFNWGLDYRGAVFAPLEGDSDRDVAAFPMQADFYLFGRLHEKISLYANAGLTGSRNRGSAGFEFDDFVQELITVRELFAKVDRMPGNSYVLAGRLTPSYGWRTPDHTSFIRRDLGFDQNRQVFGIEGGYNPNYLFTKISGFAQGLEQWPGDGGDTGFGATATGGWRDLGWQLFGSLHYLDRTGEGIDELTSGLSWGVNLYPLVYLGEMDLKLSSSALGDSTAFFAYHEFNYMLTTGLSAMFKYDWQDPDANIIDDHRDRYTVGVQWEPYTYLQFLLQYRINTQALEVGEQDLLLMLHAWL